MTVLVTGGRGFIGRHVADLLRARGTPCVVIERAWQEIDEVAASVGDVSIERCIHLGWYANPPDYLTAVAPNLRSLASAIQLVEWLIERGCQHLVVSGTSAEYAPSTDPIDETSPLASEQTVYAASKASLRVLLRSSWTQEQTGIAWARIFGVTGPGEHPLRLLPSVARAVATSEPMDMSAGEQIRDYLDVRDVASALVRLSDVRAQGDFNVSSGKGIAVRELIERVTRGCDVRVLRYGTLPLRPGETPYIVGESRRLRESTGWEPEVSLERSFADLRRWMGL